MSDNWHVFAKLISIMSKVDHRNKVQQHFFCGASLMHTVYSPISHKSPHTWECGVTHGATGWGNSPILKVTLLGSSREREPSPSSTSAEIANLGRRPEHLLKLVLSVSEEWEREGLEKRNNLYNPLGKITFNKHFN